LGADGSFLAAGANFLNLLFVPPTFADTFG
jgi:hypothetical protein